MRASNLAKEARVVELKTEHAQTLGAAVRPPDDPGAGLDGVLEVGGVRIAADILGKILGGFTVEQELASAVCKRACAREQELETARAAAAAAAGGGARVLPTDAEAEAAAGQPAGEDAMDDEELGVDEQLEKLKAFNRTPMPSEGDEQPSDDAARAAFKRTFEELGAAPPKRARKA